MTFEDVYKRFWDDLKWYCYRRLRDISTAEDIAQTIFLRLLPVYEQIQEPAVASWLYVTATHLIIDEKRKRVSVSLEQQDLECLSSELEVDLLCADRDQIRQAWDILTPTQRQLFELHASGYSFVEIAEILRLNYGACKTLAWRTRRFLAKKVG